MDAKTIVIGAVVFLIVYYLWIIVKSTRKAMREEEKAETAPSTSNVKQSGDSGKAENGEEKTSVVDKVIEIVIIVAVIALFASCSTNCSRYEGSEERWNELSPQEQRNAEQSNEYMNTLDSMRDN